MTPRQHSLYARRLIEACGGIIEAADACRLGKSALSNAQNVNQESCFLPADVIADLEAYCGASIYSRELVDAAPPAGGSGDVMADALCLNQMAAELTVHLNQALADGILTSREQSELMETLADLDGKLVTLKADVLRRSPRLLPKDGAS